MHVAIQALSLVTVVYRHASEKNESFEERPFESQLSASTEGNSELF